MAVPAVVSVALILCEITVPLPGVFPETPVPVVVQLKLVPGMVLLKLKFVLIPEQTVCAVGVDVAAGIELTVTVIG